MKFLADVYQRFRWGQFSLLLSEPTADDQNVAILSRVDPNVHARQHSEKRALANTK